MLALLGTAAAVHPSLPARADIGAISYAGTCAFNSAGPNALTLTATTTMVTLTGQGACTNSTGSGLITVNLAGLGDYGCRRSTGSAYGQVYFDPRPPNDQLEVMSTVVVGSNTLQINMTNTSSDFYAVGQFSWSGSGSGCLTTGMDGTLTFASS